MYRTTKSLLYHWDVLDRTSGDDDVMEIVCWNIRWGKGRNGVVDLARIVQTATAMGDPDVLCFQEVARHFAALDGSGEDQVKVFRDLLPGFAALFGAGTDIGGDAGERRQFGNLILTRLPVFQAHRHLLPRPAIEERRHMQRAALEVVVGTSSGPLRITNTHLEYYSAAHRAAQVERLRLLYNEACAHPSFDPGAAGTDAKPATRPIGRCPAILCGDFNMEKSEAAYGQLLQSFADGTPALLDAWTVVHPGKEHPATCGIYELISWPAPNCRDFIFLTPDLAERARTMDSDATTDASDHQPLRLVLDS
ncbi:MAG: endonuclease/exonuclease/phosphatase family protein [Acidiferrobacterales bacterium]